MGSFLTPCVFAMEPLKTACITIDHHSFTVEIAKTQEEQARGLQFRDHLDADRGMIFPYEKLQPLVFWMKDCKIALDLLFFNHHQLVHYVDSAPPCQLPANQCAVYPSQALADTVIELQAGTRKKYGFNTHSQFQFCPSDLGKSHP